MAQQRIPAQWGGTLVMIASVIGGCANFGAAGSSVTRAATRPAQAETAAFTVETPAASETVTDPYEQAVESATDPLSPKRLILVARYGHEGQVRFLLQNGVDVNTRGPLGVTALIAAAEGGHGTVVALLLSHGADPNLQTQTGESALIGAAARGDVETIKQLLAAGAKVDLATSNGETALFYAVRFGQLAAAEMLLNHGANPNRRNHIRVNASNAGYTPLMYAAARGTPSAQVDWVAMIELLLRHGADPNIKNSYGYSALAIAENNRDYELVTVLRKAGALKERAYNSLSEGQALIKAARLGDLAKIEWLLQRGADPNYADSKGVTPLLAATYHGRVKIAQKLIDKGARLNVRPSGLREWAFRASSAPLGDRELMASASRGDTPLLLAIRRDQGELVELYLQKGADPNLANGQAELPVFVAAELGRASVVALLLKAGVDPNTMQKEVVNSYNASIGRPFGKNTPLIKAAQGGHGETVKVLIDAGADINHRGVLAKTALLWATERGHFRTAELLLEEGADPNLPSAEGLTPLMIAARNGYRHLAQVLVERGADVNAIEKTENIAGTQLTFGATGMTALMYAARGGHREIVELLLDAGAEVNVISRTGKTAMKEASHHGYDQIVEILKVAGGRL